MLEQGKLSQAKAIQQKLSKEKQNRWWRNFRNAIHGEQTQGGLSAVIITSPNKDPITQLQNETYVNNTHLMNETLLSRNIKHFSQSHGTPFTISPLLDIVGSNGCSKLALEILEGNIPTNIPKNALLQFQEMKQIRDPMPLSLSFNDMYTGFQKWREATTTSPSDKHLGIYKSLINAHKFEIQNHTTTQNQSQNDNQPIALTALQIQFQLMNLAVRECHTYK
jgi:hypothetical protein